MTAVSVIPKFTRGLFAYHEDPYAILGTPIGASHEQINRSFRRMAMALRSGFVGGSAEADQAAQIFIKLVAPARSTLTKSLERAEYDANLTLLIQRLLQSQGRTALMPTTVEALWLCQAPDLEKDYLKLVDTIAGSHYQSLDKIVDQLHRLSELNLAYLLLKYSPQERRSSRAAEEVKTPSKPTPTATLSPRPTSTAEESTQPATHAPSLLQERRRKAEEHYQEALDWLNRHHLRKAIQVLGLAIAQDPDQARYYLERGRLLHQLDDLSLARADYDQVIRLDASNRQAMLGLQEILAKVATQPLNRTTGSTPIKQKAQQIYQEALGLIAEKRYSEAFPLLDGAINTDPTNTTYLLERARLLRRDGNLDMARADYDQVIYHDPHNAEALQGLRDILMQSISPISAPEEPEEPDLLAMSREEARLRHQQALRMIEREQFREAIQYLSIAVDRDPGNVEYYLERARTQRKVGNLGMARSDYKRVIQIDPNHPEAQKGLRETNAATSHQQKIPDSLLGKKEPKSQLERILFSDISYLLPKKKDKGQDGGDPPKR